MTVCIIVCKHHCHRIVDDQSIHVLPPVSQGPLLLLQFLMDIFLGPCVIATWSCDTLNIHELLAFPEARDSGRVLTGETPNLLTVIIIIYLGE